MDHEWVQRWIGVDFDGTLAFYKGDVSKLGHPIPRTVRRVQEKLEEGILVKVFTARVSGAHLSPAREAFVHDQRMLIQAWTEQHIGRRLDATCEKDFACIEIWDDRARGFVANEGITHDEKLRAEAAARFVLAQVADYSSRGLTAPWRTLIQAELNPYELDAVAQLVSETGLSVTCEPKVGGGFTCTVSRGVVSAGAAALITVGRGGGRHGR